MAPFSLSSQGGCSRELPSKRPEQGHSNLRVQEEWGELEQWAAEHEKQDPVHCSQRAVQ